jgi:hypothetical protein
MIGAPRKMKTLDVLGRISRKREIAGKIRSQTQHDLKITAILLRNRRRRALV